MTEQQENQIRNYLENINKQIKECYVLANKARKQGYDPSEKTEIPVAKNIAERVIGLISVLAPQITNTKIIGRIQELEKKYSILHWKVSLIIAEEIAREKFCKFENKLQAIEIGVKVGFAYHTLGVVPSPLEGLSKIKIRKRKDNGNEYFALYFSGPIRSAGGTGASVCVLIADHVRKKLGYDVYDPSEEEINRMATELYDYHERITNLQYLPSEEEIKFMIKNLPVQIDGDPSEKIEVSRFKDLDRIETNKIRNGVCLVTGEALCQKAPKLWKQLSKWGNEMGMEQWNFLKDFLDLQKKIKSHSTEKQEKEEDRQKISPDYTFIKDLVAGRPVLTHPLRTGGFRLRYGRSRVSGFSSAAVHPNTMRITNKYLATGTQLKLERPGKAAVFTVCDSIEGPIVKLKDQSVVMLESESQTKKLLDQVEEVLFLGDILINYGDFFNRAHPLAPPGFCEEWWIQELEKAIVDTFGSLDFEKAAEYSEIPPEIIAKNIKNPFDYKPTPQQAVGLSEKFKIPLHPRYTYHWKSLSPEQLLYLIEKLKKASIEKNKQKIVFLKDEKLKRILEIIGIPHIFLNKEFIIIEKQDSPAFLALFDNIDKAVSAINENKEKNTIELINLFSRIKIKDKSGIFVGARMGRPEKAKMRKLTGSPHVLFPVGEEGGRMRSFQSALEKGFITSDFPVYYCPKCKKETIYSKCEKCGSKAEQKYWCRECKKTMDQPCKKHHSNTYKKREIDIRYFFEKSMKKAKMKVPPDLIKGVRGTSNEEHNPEHLIKGILRAKNEIYVNKDGTTRYDMTQIGITHFKPKEISTSVEKLKQLGYEKDIYGKNLENDEQTIELLPQDVILPACVESPEDGADKVFFNVANFIDELLKSLYNLKPYYNLNSINDLVGHLVIGLAPHTSAGIVGRIIGVSKTQGYFAHPIFHAAHRRDLDGDESCLILLLDALINFSRSYLPGHKGATQDAPLVLTSELIPGEVDDMVFDMDIAWKYPLDFYKACEQYKNPWDIKINQVSHHLGKPTQYFGMGYTHPTASINTGVRCSAYKTLPSMEEKLKGQMELAEKIRAVDTGDVAALVIEKHFIRDIKGNLRKFSMQQFRCVDCNEKFRRPPLAGKCTNCGGKIIFTISEGSVIKYLEPSISLAEKYHLPSYLRQSLELVKRRIEGVFGKEKERQEGLGKWFG